jgi:hypothetical protein
VEVDEDCGPDGLERRFSSAEVAALASVVAVDDESEKPLDAGAGAVKVLVLSWVGQRLECGLAQVLAAPDPDVSLSARRAAGPQWAWFACSLANRATRSPFVVRRLALGF